MDGGGLEDLTADILFDLGLIERGEIASGLLGIEGLGAAGGVEGWRKGLARRGEAAAEVVRAIGPGSRVFVISLWPS